MRDPTRGDEQVKEVSCPGFEPAGDESEATPTAAFHSHPYAIVGRMPLSCWTRRRSPVRSFPSSRAAQGGSCSIRKELRPVVGRPVDLFQQVFGDGDVHPYGAAGLDAQIDQKG